MSTETVDPHLTAKIVRNYVRHHTVEVGGLSGLITIVHRALGELGQPYHPEEVRTPAVSVRRSVQQDYVVCLDCGYRGKTLRRHISTRHGLTRDEYLERWALRNDHPLTAPALYTGEGTGARSEAQSTGGSGSVTSSSTKADRSGSGTQSDAQTETEIPFCNEYRGCGG